ncbi:2-polyprenyl-6-methoxyphenol hydroxylase-like oxidoreductase [Mycolicibacterium elephantis]|uniref:FAD-dependent oxidoreductase n=1 Tax=Mycolicibacterium elephantis TaxID=81858 RepID=UPI0007EB7948|nr:FAD-dependent monooxygenase [Mycolicibacterium elephantis]OBE98049.1 2-polyprenyl-6-methoxyphenol hydroxylase-like oxidoreductase [Mycolicibacterium elephantis]
MPVLGERAIVLGASMSGLLAARVLTDCYRGVTVVERDALPDEPINRRGVPQGRHVHALLARGAKTLNELFPGILDELVADGAPVWDDAEYSRLYVSLSGHVMPRSGKAVIDPKADAMYQPSRPMLECHVRRRLRALENVTIVDGHDVAELTATPDRRRVTGVRVVQRDGGTEKDLTADLVVDAMGRAAHTPALLESLGYGRPAEDHIVTHTTYVSQMLRIPPGTVKEMMTLIGAAPGRPTGAFLLGYENDVWIFTVFGMVGHQPPRDLAGMVSFARDYVPAHVLAAVQAGEPIAPVVQHRLPSSQWRRYDKMRRFPEGLVVTGDAMCSFNPVYGQGMSVAAMDALALRDALHRGTSGLSRRYFRAAAKSIGVAWRLAAGSDLAFSEVEGRRTRAMQLTNRFSEWVLTACETDAVVHAQFFRVVGLVEPPSRLFGPSFIYRVAAVNRRGRRRASQPEPPQLAGVVDGVTP